jgi:glucokinase
MLDVGGTKIKGGILNESGILLNGRIHSFDSKSNRSKDEIFDNFADIIEVLSEQIEDTRKQIMGIGLAFPGPFDYANGISKMLGLNKYDTIYDCDFKKELLEKMNKKSALVWMKKDLPFAFVHDVEAFAIGESHCGTAADYHRVMYLCIGTGSGSSFSEDKNILKVKTDNFPENGWIYKTPFKDSIIDDYVSSRGLSKISEKFLGEAVEGSILYRLAAENQEGAILTFREFGHNAAEALIPYLESFKPGCLVLGGQISKSYSFFGAELEQYCKEHQITVSLAEDTSVSILKGLFIQINKYN